MITTKEIIGLAVREIKSKADRTTITFCYMEMPSLTEVEKSIDVDKKQLDVFIASTRNAEEAVLAVVDNYILNQDVKQLSTIMTTKTFEKDFKEYRKHLGEYK